ncbi:putative HTLV-1-related endogenous sequence [Felis catus]|uniref:putative HTLV-1-related endogenous sequence n=1 Tax=Felis catus TaxID=9685 RepID=UPI001D19D1F1|nr:putative HTLV-1-related endogenous sequence [Felis catus]
MGRRFLRPGTPNAAHSTTRTTSQTRGCVFSPPPWPRSAPLCPPTALHRTFGAHRLRPSLAATPGRSPDRPPPPPPPPSPRPRRLQAGRHFVALSPAGRRGRGPQRREHLAEQRLGSRRGSAAAAAAASPGSGSGAADPDPTIPKPTGATGLRLHARSQTQRGPRRPLSPEARGGDVAIQSSPRPSDTKPTLRGPTAFLCFIIVFQAARVVFFTLGRGPRGAHVGSSCYGLPGRLPWVTGPRPAGSLPATQSPPQPPPAERPGGRRRERACAGRGAGECARAAEAPQPTGGRGCSGGSATASGVGAKL